MEEEEEEEEEVEEESILGLMKINEMGADAGPKQKAKNATPQSIWLFRLLSRTRIIALLSN